MFVTVNNAKAKKATAEEPPMHKRRLMISGKRLLAVPLRLEIKLMMKIKRFCRIRKVTKCLMLLKLLTNLMFLCKTKLLVRYVGFSTMQLRIVEG